MITRLHQMLQLNHNDEDNVQKCGHIGQKSGQTKQVPTINDVGIFDADHGDIENYILFRHRDKRVSKPTQT